jgi:hypothetical protein
MPTLVNTGDREILMLAGGFLVRNIYAFFFCVVALFTLYKERLLKLYIVIISIIFILIRLGSSGFALSEHPFASSTHLMNFCLAFSNRSKIKFYTVFVYLSNSNFCLFKLTGRDLI